MPLSILGLETEDIQNLLGPDQPRFRARQIYEAVYRQKVSGVGEISTLPATLRNELAERLVVHDKYLPCGHGTRYWFAAL